MEKPRLSRQTSVRCFVTATVLLCTAAPASAAEAAVHRTARHVHGHPRAAAHHAGAQDRSTLPAPRVLTGPGFDTCWAPPADAMAAWYKNSAYRAIGVYIGGVNRACTGGNLTPDWVGQVSAQGWSLMPVYVGLQAPCAKEHGMTPMKVAQAAAEGQAAAADAVAQADAYGMERGSAVYYDLEAFNQNDQGCVRVVLDYLDAWTRGLHAEGYYSGVYSSAASGIARLADAVQTQPGFAAPDAIWIARWDLQARTADDSVPGMLWDTHQRIKQYQGGHVEKHGGTAVDIDGDWLDGPVARIR